MGMLRPHLLGGNHAESRCGRLSSSRAEHMPQLQLCRACALFLPFSWELRDSVNMNAGHIKKEKEKKKAFPVQRPNRSPIDSANVKNIWQKNTTLFQIKTTWVPKGVTITLKNLGQFQSHHQLFGWNVCYVSGMVASNLNQNRGPKSSELRKNSGLLPGVSWARLSSGPRRSLLPD